MKSEISISINPDNGEIELGVKDITTYPYEGSVRSDLALLFKVYKTNIQESNNITTIQNVSLSLADGFFSDIVETLDDNEQSQVKFKVGKDGLHKILLLPVKKTPLSTEGDYYYDGENILYYESGLYSVVTSDELFGLIQDFPEGSLVNFPVNPGVSIRLDEIAQKYAKGRSGSSDPDFKQFNTLYIQLYGALLSFDKGAFLDYERKIRAAIKLF